MYQDPAQHITSAIICGRYYIMYWLSPGLRTNNIIIWCSLPTQTYQGRQSRAINEATLKINSLPILVSFHTIYLGYSEIFYLISSTQLDIQWGFQCRYFELAYWSALIGFLAFAHGHTHWLTYIKTYWCPFAHKKRE